MMTKLLTLTGLLLTCITLAQTPEKIYPKNKVFKSNEYYTAQMLLWKLEVEKHPKNADAWFNYYRASRNAYIKGDEDNTQKSKGINRFNRLKKIVDTMENQIPDSYEYNFVKWLNGNNDFSLFPFLVAAHTIAPKNAEPIMSLIFYHEIKGDYNQRDKYVEEYYNLNEYSPGLLNYSYNLLTGLEKNAIIITEGDKDTEAILLLTKGKKFRTDIQMLNVNLLLIKEYRERILKELDILPVEFDPMNNDESFERFCQLIIRQIAANKQGRPVYIAVTVSPQYTNQIIKNLYIIGLAYLYSTNETNNITVLKTNIEQLFLLDYLKVYFPFDISIGNVKSMNGNYLIPFATISQHYFVNGNKLKANYYKDLAWKVAVESERCGEFNNYFSGN